MNVFDIVVVIIVIVFAIKGLKNGLIKELGSLIALITGIFIAIRFSCFVESFLKDKDFFSSEYLPIISFAVTFIGVVIAVILFSKVLDQFVKIIKLQWLNKLAGACFGILKIIIILGGLTFLILKFNEKFNMFSDSFLAKSKLFNPILSIFKYIFPYIEKLC